MRNTFVITPIILDREIHKGDVVMSKSNPSRRFELWNGDTTMNVEWLVPVQMFLSDKEGVVAAYPKFNGLAQIGFEVVEEFIKTCNMSMVLAYDSEKDIFFLPSIHEVIEAAEPEDKSLSYYKLTKANMDATMEHMASDREWRDRTYVYNVSFISLNDIILAAWNNNLVVSSNDLNESPNLRTVKFHAKLK